ncbi:MAG: DUF1214 domain-containing protein [Burkholderiaceae bacterium]
MNLTTQRAIAGVLLSSGLIAGPAHALSVEEARKIAFDAYVYGYSLITTEVTRVQGTNVPAPERLRAPIGHFINLKRYPTAEHRVVSAPNADTLYSVVWLDVGKEPWVFSYPDLGERYAVFPMYSLWMPVIESGGTRTTGQKAHSFLITGPGWSGKVPEGMTHVKSTTRYAVMLARIYADGTEADYEATNALQAKLDARPLSAVGKANYEAPIAPIIDPGYSMTQKPQDVILGFGVEEYFQRMADLMCDDAPPVPEDAPMLAEMAKIGLEPCKPFKLAALGPDVVKALSTLPQDALKAIDAIRPSLQDGKSNGWLYRTGTGRYKTNYMKRAAVAAFGWPSNLQEDAVYPYIEADSEGRPLTGEHKYTVTFANKDALPPVNAFWSITMYELDKGWWFTPNPLNKYTVSPRDKLVANADGSITLYFQHESPGADRQANWLPAPKGPFLAMLRMYWPKEKSPSIFDGSWVMPSVKRVD